MWNKHKLLMGDLRFGMKRFLEYQLITKAILTLLIWPFLKLILNTLFKIKGLSYVTNGMLTKVFISPQGVFSIVLFSIVMLFVILIELGGLILMSYQVINREPAARYLPTLRHCMTKMPRFFGFEGLLLVIGVGIALPWLEMGGSTSLISSLQIPGFVQDVINSSILYSLIELGVFLLVLYLAARYLFVLHYIMLENDKSKLAFRKSAALMKKNTKKLLKEALGVTLINALLQVFIMLIVSGLLAAAILVPDIPPELFEYALYAALFLGIAIWLGLAFLMTPLGTLMLTRFYLENRVDNGELVDIKLTKVPENRIIDKIFFRRRNIVIVLIVSVLGSALLSVGLIEQMRTQQYDVKITAHRGNVKYAPENTIAALNTASENGAHYAEIDVQQSSDGVLVLLHDSSLKRTTGEDANVWELTYDEIKSLDAGSQYSDAYAGEGVPTLSQAIEASKGKIRLNIEIKINGHEQDIVQKVVDEIYKHGIQNTCVVTSLDYDTLQEVEALKPELKTGYIMFVALGDLSMLNIDFYSVEENNVTENFVTTAHLLGREVHVWTINEADDMRKLINLGVDNIITDDEILLKKTLEPQTTSQGFITILDNLL